MIKNNALIRGNIPATELSYAILVTKQVVEFFVISLSMFL